MTIVSRFQKILHTHTLRQSAITVSSMFLSAFLGAIYYIVLARMLSTSDYGLFSLGMLVLQIGVTISDLGLGQSVVRFIGQNRESNNYFPYANLALRIKFASGGLICIILSVFSDFLADKIFHQHLLANFLPFVGLGVFSLSLFGFSLSLFQGLQKFFLWGALQISVNLLRLFVLVPIFWFGFITPSFSLLSYIIAVVIFFLAGWHWINRDVLFSKITKLHIQAFFSYNLWTALFGIVSTLVSRIDTFLVARYLTLSHTGVYSLAVTMNTFMPQLSTAIGAVTSAKLAGFKDRQTERKYLIKATIFSAGIGLSTAFLMLPVALVVIRFTNNADYSLAFNPFVFLLISSIIFTALNPIRDSILYYFAKPKFFFWANLAQGLALLIISPLLIRQFETTGSAISVLISQVLFAVLCLWYYNNVSHRAHYS